MLWSQQSQVGQDASARLIHDDESVEGVYKQHLWKEWKYSKDTLLWRKQIIKIWTKQVLWKLTSTRASKSRPSKLWGAFKSSFELWDLWLDFIWTIRPLTRVRKTPSARQQCWPKSFCRSGKFLRQVYYWLKNFWILCNTKYPDNMQCPDELECFRTILEVSG